MKKSVLLLGALFGGMLSAQPAVTLIGNNYGWVSPGSPSYGIAQGAIFAIKGTNMGPAQYPTLLPTPKVGDQGVAVKVTVGSTTVDVPTYYVWNVQVAGVLPSNTPPGDGTLTISYNGQASQAVPIKVVSNAFGILTMDSSGQGTAKVCDWSVDNTCTSYPSLAKPARPEDFISLWGSGLGPTGGDATGVDLTKTVQVKVWIGGQSATVQYAGRSVYVGLDQINTTIPKGVDGCYVSVVVQIGNNISNFTSIPVSATGAACSDPVTGMKGDTLSSITGKQSFRIGYIGLSHTMSQSPALPGVPATDTTDEMASGAFYQFTPVQYANIQQILPQASFGSCSLWTFTADQNGNPIGVDMPTPLDAGAITVTSNGVSKVMERDAATRTYNLDLKSPSFFSGTVAVEGAGGNSANAVGPFHATMDVPSGFTWANRADVNTITRANGQPITWQNAAAGTMVVMSGMSMSIMEPIAIGMFVCIAPAEANQFTIPSYVLLALPASGSVEGFSIPTGHLAVSNGAKPVAFTATGLDQGLVDFSISSSKGVIYQ